MQPADAAALDVPAPRRATRRAWSDAALLRAARQGSQAAVEELFHRHWPAAHRAAYWVVHDAAAAEDIAQEAFLAALRTLDRFDRRRPFRPWLHRVVINRAIDHARARELRREVGDRALAARAVDDPEPVDGALLAALAALPVDQRAAVVLRHVAGHTPAEVAAILGVPRGTVNSRLRRGLDAIAETLRD